MIINYEALLKEVLALWPDQIEWQKSQPPVLPRVVQAFEVVFDEVECAIAQETDEACREFKGIMNWALKVGFSTVLKDEQIEQQGKTSGVLHKSDLPLVRVKKHFIENIADDFWVDYMREHKIVITGLE